MFLLWRKCLVLFLLLASALLFAETQEEKDLLRLVERQVGPQVSENENPSTYKLVRQHFDRLAAAHAELLGQGMVAINEIHIIESSEPNAFVGTLQREGIGQQKNLVFVTTAMLELCYERGKGTPTSEAMNRGSRRLAGILAHELAHPMDKADSSGIEGRWGRARGSQAMEIRADSDAVRILKKALYPKTGLYEALQLLDTLERERPSPLEAAASSHPPLLMRTTSQRMLLTLDRYENGAYEPTYPQAEPPGLLRELEVSHQVHEKERAQKKEFNSFEAPKNLDEAFALTERLAPSVKGGARNWNGQRVWERDRFNAALLYVDHFLSTQPLVAKHDIDRLIRLKESILNPENGWVGVYWPEELKRQLSQDHQAALKIAKNRSHHEFMKQVPIYSSQRYRQWARDYYEKNLADPKTTSSSLLLATLEKILPTEVVLSEFRKEIAERLSADFQKSKGHDGRIDKLRAINRGVSLNLQAGITEILHSEVLPKLSAQDQFHFHLEGDPGRRQAVPYDLTLFRYALNGDTNSISPKEHTREEIKRQLRDPRYQERRDNLKKAATAFWNHRGKYATMDYFLPDQQGTDWDLVFELLGKNPVQGRKELAEAVKAYTVTPDYQALLTYSYESNLGQSRNDPHVSWQDPTLFPYLTGQKNPLLANPQGGGLAHWTRHAYLTNNEGVYRKMYSDALKQALETADAGTLNLEGLVNLDEKAKKTTDRGFDDSPHLTKDLLARALRNSSLPAEKRKELLAGYFLQNEFHQRGHDGEAPKAWIAETRHEANEQILKILMDVGALKEVQDYFRLLLPKSKASGAYQGPYFRAVEANLTMLRRELKAIQTSNRGDQKKHQELTAFVKTYLDPFDGNYTDLAFGNSKLLRQLKDEVVRVALALPASAADRRELFLALTGTGSTSATDTFLKEALIPEALTRADSRRNKFLTRILTQERVNSQVLELSLGRTLILPRVASLRKVALAELKGRPNEGAAARGPQNLASPRQLASLLDDLSAVVPRDSTEKDRFLNEIAWELGVEDPALLGLIEAHKSSNWKKANPSLINWATFFTENISQLDRNGIQETLTYLLDPKGKKIPRQLEESLKRSTHDEAVEFARQQRVTNIDVEKYASDLHYASLRRMESMALDATSHEKIPLIDELLNAGKEPLAKDPSYPLNLSRKHAGFAADSTDEKLLRAFIDTVPEEEKTSSLSYLLSTQGGDKKGVKEIFQVFQTVGIKGGQFAAIWKLFSDPVNTELADLKDGAEPLTKFEIEQILRKDLTAEEFAKIKHIQEEIGSASLKTVVRLQMHSGPDIVVAIQNPKAEAQIRNNLAFGRRYIENLKKYGLSLEAGLFENMIATIERQLTRELDFRLEAESIQHAKKYYEGLNASLSKEMGHWEFVVPNLVKGFQVRKNILFLEEGHGVGFDEMKEETKEEKAGKKIVGESIAVGTLRGLFRGGWFDADRHARNQLIDEANHKIYMIDFGQAEQLGTSALPWRTDDRYKLAQFMRALDARDAAGLMEHGLSMTDNAGAGANRAALLSRISALLGRGGKAADHIADIYKAFTEAGAAFSERFSFGAMKALMTVYGEGYVEAHRFEEILRDEIGRLLLKKAPRTWLDERNRTGLLRCAFGFGQVAEPGSP